MRKTLAFVSIALAVAGAAHAESSVRSRPVGVFVQPLPPNLTATVSFEEPSGNRALDALEEGAFVVRVENAGQGDGYDVAVKLSCATRPEGLRFSERTAIGTVPAGKSATVRIPVSADEKAPDQKLLVTFEFTEGGGFDPDPVAVAFEARAYATPKLIVADVGIDDGSGNGQVEPQEVVEVTCRVQNVGAGDAAGVTAVVAIGENLFPAQGSKTDHDLGTLAPGAYRDFTFSFYTNKRVKPGQPLPLSVTLREGRGRFEAEEPLKIAVNVPQKTAREVVVEGVARADPREFERAGGLSVDVDREIPEGASKNPDAVAVVIGVRNYRSRDVPPVEFADRDAETVRQYLVRTLGFSPDQILFVPDAGFADFRQLFGTPEEPRGKLARWVKPGKSDVFVYYAGHGAPDLKSHGAYFVPSDADPNYIASSGYPLALFWESLAKAPARTLTVVLDTCFSGNVEGGKILLRDVSPALLKVRPELRGPEGSVVMTSAAADQVSTWYREKRHSLFTYYWLKGLGGEADANHDGAVTAGELGGYVKEHVAYQAGRLAGREQTPVVHGDDNVVLVRLAR